jgi:GWxTD domain-containing protein
MKIKFTYFLLSLIGLSFSLWAQYLGPNPNSGRGIPYFEFRTYRVYHTDQAYIIALSEILYDDLTFEKKGDNYVARYDLTVYIQIGETDRAIGYITRDYTVKLSDFDETNSRILKDRRTFQFNIKPGDYNLVAIITDRKTGKRVKRNIELLVEDINEKGILVSDILFFKTNPATGERFLVVSVNFSRSDKMIWAQGTVTTLNATDPIRLQFYYEESEDRYGFEVDTTIAPKGLLDYWYAIDLTKRKKSQNILKVTASQAGKTYETEHRFTFFWSEVPQTVTDINIALKEMIYVAPEDSIDKYLELDMKEKVGYFQRFWKNLDPSPATERNELKEEYFNRVAFVNRAFGFFKVPGYKTDRGRIYIKFGPPDEIERHPFEADSYPYIIWYYNNLKKVFLFVDKNGLGEYRLDQNYMFYEYN